MKQSSSLLQASFDVCRLLISERDLATLLQAICDHLVDSSFCSSALLVLVDRSSQGVIAAETGVGAHLPVIMTQLKQGQFPACGARALESETLVPHLCKDCTCGLCSTAAGQTTHALCAPLHSTADLVGFFLLHLPLQSTPSPEEIKQISQLSETISLALRQLMQGEEARYRERALKQVEQRYELALHASQAGLWDWNIKTGEIYTSPNNREYLDYRAGDMDSVQRAIHPEDRQRVLNELNDHLTGKTQEYCIEYRVRGERGQWEWFLDRGRVIERDDNQMPVRMTGTHQNVNQQKMQEQAVAMVQQQLHEAVDLERNFLQTVIDSAGDPVMVIDLEYNVLLINRAASLLSRVQEGAEATGKCYALFHGADRPCEDPAYPCPVRAVAQHLQPVTLEHTPYHGNEITNTYELEVSPLLNREGEFYGIIEVARDISDRLRIEKELRDSQSHFYRLAHHDILTGLPNRLLFRDRLSHATQKAQRNQSRVGLLFLDLDKFKTINDQLGHDVGDALLVEVASRLQQQCRQSDTVARLGGDEFVFVLEDLHGPQDAGLVAVKVMQAMAKPVRALHHELQVTTSIGIALYPDDADSMDEVLKLADLALYAAKESGRSNYQFYRPEFNPDNQRPQLGREAFVSALEQHHFALLFQPQFDPQTRNLVGCTVEYVWHHPEMGVMKPPHFMGAAAECGMVPALSSWLVEELITFTASLPAHQERLPMTLLLAYRQLLDNHLLVRLEQACAAGNLWPKALRCGLRERVVTEISDHGLQHLHRLQELGIGFALYEFGTHHCSLPLLQRLPLECLVLSGCMLADVPENVEKARLVSAAVAVARSLSLHIMVDGVEREEHCQFLADLGCDALQGPLWGPALGAAEISALWAEEKKGS